MRFLEELGRAFSYGTSLGWEGSCGRILRMLCIQRVSLSLAGCSCVEASDVH